MKQTINLLVLSVALTSATPLTQLAQATFSGESGALTGDNVNQDLLDIAESLGVGSWGLDTVQSLMTHIDEDIEAAALTLSTVEPNVVAAVGSAKDEVINHVTASQTSLQGTSDFGTPTIGLQMT